MQIENFEELPEEFKMYISPTGELCIPFAYLVNSFYELMAMTETTLQLMNESAITDSEKTMVEKLIKLVSSDMVAAVLPVHDSVREYIELLDKE